MHDRTDIARSGTTITTRVFYTRSHVNEMSTQGDSIHFMLNGERERREEEERCGYHHHYTRSAQEKRRIPLHNKNL